MKNTTLFRGGRKSVLLCEDNPVEQKLLQRAFGLAGFEAIVAESPSDAVRMMKRCDISAALIDVHLREGDGFDVVLALRQTGRQVPVLMMTGLPTESLRSRARDAGAVGFLEKPFSLDEAVEQISEATRNMRRSLRGASVLVVEGFPSTRERVGKTLEEIGFEVRLARNEAEALSRLEERGRLADLALVDLDSSEVGGPAFIRRLRSAAPGLCVVMMSAGGCPERVRRGYEAGAHTFFQKPLRIELLGENMVDLLPLGRQMRADAVREIRRSRCGRGTRLVRDLRAVLRRWRSDLTWRERSRQALALLVLPFVALTLLRVGQSSLSALEEQREQARRGRLLESLEVRGREMDEVRFRRNVLRQGLQVQDLLQRMERSSFLLGGGQS